MFLEVKRNVCSGRVFDVKRANVPAIVIEDFRLAISKKGVSFDTFDEPDLLGELKGLAVNTIGTSMSESLSSF